ncbi:hypothetical protein D3C81_834150 [compost metagenome]
MPPILQLGTDPAVQVLHQLVKIVLQLRQLLKHWSRFLPQTRLFFIEPLLIQARVERTQLVANDRLLIPGSARRVVTEWVPNAPVIQATPWIEPGPLLWPSKQTRDPPMRTR